MKNNRGMTLIELLATLSLTFMVGSVIFSVTMSTIHHYQQSEIQSQVNSDLNRFISNLTDIHQTYKKYTITRIDSSTYVVELPEEKNYTFKGSVEKYDLYIGKRIIEDGEVISNTKLTDGDSFEVSNIENLDLLIEVTDITNRRFKPVTISTSISQIIGVKDRD
ncbi:PulJ/GspJ family protein [Piscibacillus halophilus]|uniref:Prepilin-type N-terminal cleavage/methylation domain-containing protein n=1 Tax=Piscibacillus halophilus TaxID=571933 RepID=A0A1H9GHF4_9BACI|nr:prepilin-type N-terminal cleavage/methylation domain-containing protein [Piscibacillus halophilus]SEQ49469.1 prepilin-type N-terminal cleavage/methylation domain-containing protein [Piscibacillus halophilus]